MLELLKKKNASTSFSRTRSSYVLSPLLTWFLPISASKLIEMSHSDIQRRLALISNHLNPGSNPQSYVQPCNACGIIAVVGNSPVSDALYDGLKIMEPRGYDSVGVTTIDEEKKLVTTKYASRDGVTSNAIQILGKKLHLHDNHVVGIAHTRWATHGGLTDANAHPHHDQNDRIAVAHNGVIENSAELKDWLIVNYNIKFKSETDTEVISQLIGLYVAEGLSIEDAVRKTTEKLAGTWGLVVLDRMEPEKLVVSKNGSPMLIGIAEGRTFAASEAAAFGRYTKEYIALKDQELAILTPKGHSLDVSRVSLSEVDLGEATPHPYPNWTIKEILEQPHAISRALNYGGRLWNNGSKLGGLESNAASLVNVNHLLIAACGTSLFAAMAGAQLMRSMAAFKVIEVIDAAEIVDINLPDPDDGAVLVISQSGETKDVHRVVAMAQEMGITTFSIINSVGSLIARTTNCGVYLNAGRENAVASTKAFSCQVTVLALISLWFAEKKHPGKEVHRKSFLVDSLHRLPTSMGMVIRSGIHDQCKDIAANILAGSHRHMFVLGKGYGYPIALEGALKIKEISYIHAEGYSGGALKHGPFALITEGMPIIFIILDDAHAAKLIVAVEETKARGARCITITNIRSIYKNHRKDMGDVIQIASNGPLTSLLAMVPLQLLAYELSLQQGINPDRPRHLAKTVTVD